MDQNIIIASALLKYNILCSIFLKYWIQFMLSVYIYNSYLELLFL